ncbi:calcium-binding protein [Microvirga flavescens]|uniref:calcium-binding protein n=1 Tax=Microvirga flavescens TaxID=2249811 RepID=UPI000DD81D6F|nr:hypothetical protein [Microvirga flavescens]
MAATIVLSASTVEENSDKDIVVGSLSVTGGKDGETFTFATNSNLFYIEGDKLLVKEGAVLDFETLSLIAVSITAASTATSGGKTPVSPQTLTISLTDVNEAPTDITLTGGSVAEDSAIGTEVASLTGVDQDADDVLTYSLVTDETGTTAATSDLFEIAGSKIKLKAVPDQAKVGSYNVWVKVADADGLSYVKQLTLNVADALENVTGTNRNDRLVGSDLADAINGLAGNDKIDGKGGDDVINGGLGKDILTGGAGKDTFVFDTPVKKGHFDHIKDFNSADDTLQFNLSALKSFKVKVSKKDVGSEDHGSFKGHEKKHSFGLDKVFKKGKLEKKFFTIGDHAKDSNDFVYYNKKNGFVYLDVDGAGGKKGIEILKLKPGTKISADDFLFI